MPTYEYICTACGYEFELVQRMSDPPRKRCLKCGKKVERRIGAGAGIIFKGSGFYSTDYRSADYKARQKAESAGKAAGSESASDGAKPAAGKAGSRAAGTGPEGGAAAKVERTSGAESNLGKKD